MKSGQTFQGSFSARHSNVGRRVSSSGCLGPLDFQFEVGPVRAIPGTGYTFSGGEEKA
jgi:hypothetical protein